MMKIRTRSMRAFTLIEMLLSISLFSVLMGVLLSSLYAGSRVWNKADAALTRSAEVATALDEITWELDHLYYEKDRKEPVFALGTTDDGVPTISYLTLEPWLGSDIPGALSQVSWKLETSDKTKILTRESQLQISGRPIGDPQKRTVLQGVQSITVQCLKDRQWVDQWKEAAPPQAIRIQVQMTGPPLIVKWASATPALAGGEQ